MGVEVAGLGQDSCASMSTSKSVDAGVEEGILVGRGQETPRVDAARQAASSSERRLGAVDDVRMAP
jgi:hypothetical protein